MSDYFLSYARLDSETALRFAADLKAAGVDLWVDQYDIAPSAHWDREVHAALLRCTGVVIILSPRSADSHNVADEISVAINSDKHVLPILIEPCVVPLRLTRVQYIDAVHDYDVALRRTVQAIRLRLGGATIAEPAPTSATPFTPKPEILTATEQKLAAVVGPIAKAVVRDAAAAATNLPDFYKIAARAIDHPQGQTAFLASIGRDEAAPEAPTAPTAISAEDIDAIAKALAAYMGPIAGLLTKREAGKASSIASLCGVLAEQIPSADDQAKFLAAAAKAGWTR